MCPSDSLELLRAIRLTVSDPLVDSALDNELQNLRRLLAFVERHRALKLQWESQGTQ